MTPFSDAMIIGGKLRLIFSETEFSEYRLAKSLPDEYIGRFGYFVLGDKTITLEFLDKSRTYNLR